MTSVPQNLYYQLNPMQEMMLQGQATELLILSCLDGQVSVMKHSLFFIADSFGIGFEQFLASEILILDEIRVEEIKTALDKLMLLNIEEVLQLLVTKAYTVEVDLPKNITAKENIEVKDETMEDVIDVEKNKLIIKSIEHSLNPDNLRKIVYEYQCDECEKKYESNKDLKRHKKAHLPIVQRKAIKVKTWQNPQ